MELAGKILVQTFQDRFGQVNRKMLAGEPVKGEVQKF